MTELLVSKQSELVPQTTHCSLDEDNDTLNIHELSSFTDQQQQQSKANASYEVVHSHCDFVTHTRHDEQDEDELSSSYQNNNFFYDNESKKSGK